ncbi:hypothetical protein NDA11_007478 [Ustilago hordei]|nr:hypothetical protein NDA10_003666 [Ustilago hordei]KAJ1572596.1 hypothetical protein NDA12_006832 [Ustilago hordei]KAJ1576241.1 hypothetical protein NDA15_006472 [Ustilago hordei]KAJ1593920.1 hypothetical protein NDA11_007478 [Ustilago hordei]UTT89196.1 hypothetical protein NDA17_004074 [Ustilago hordei]
MNKILQVDEESRSPKSSISGTGASTAHYTEPPRMQDMIWGAIWGSLSLSQIKDAEHLFEEDVGPESLLHSGAKALAGIANPVELDWISWLDNGSHCFFSPIWKAIGLRELHNICCVVYDRRNKDQRDRIRAMMKDLIDEAAKKGWSEYRTHLAFEDQVAGTFNFNNNAIRQQGFKVDKPPSRVCPLSASSRIDASHSFILKPIVSANRVSNRQAHCDTSTAHLRKLRLI